MTSNLFQLNAKNLTVMIMAGGTGGHVFPALAVADVLRKSGAHVEWLGTPRGIENSLIPAANIELHHIRVEGVRGRGFIGLVKAPFLIAMAILQAVSVFRKVKPNVVIGFGGFASGPGGVAAKMLGIPLIIHEQNAVAGTTNRLLSKIATRVLAAFSGAFSSEKIESQIVGNPVREDIANLPAPTNRYDERAIKEETLHLLVLGGSLGAKAINELVPQSLGKILPQERPFVRHQSGKNHLESTIASYMQYQVNAKVDAFVDDMAAAYAWADIVICRAGALTVSELAAAGVASVLIPLPTAIDDHQTRNADILVKADAGIVLAQKELTAEKLTALLTDQLHERANLKRMATNARSLALPQAAETVATICVEVARG
ncbi:UDP-N-acetylglucosamine--N-acetylmuramyl-(pentapeptide) pyrophosphoryl-undecaprenol N-acetylglucosamine transferase [Cellvibrio zantedeschiae]|uniref:UDP-N-acetylglucosamine--N-acetylmuramyl-(pentapeptide) pyrophosphoryl-undecaprenol N-acetylglucosamine transferase n=1 Tax=Cellvibrio zantedeschiae TaxID=1237077 RepID=A0ABQ3AQU7_9GAMM|nr:undecaprenyldiphospho-muramoylpentapeptide beta-N-acetylglucosaminyltransferase [Cellvibrio zantedeschiae]GGY62771.1 UDP-N-acetylglucosamine--N-acetylmuramyl-(pentapeptide) pyrophosphoryl-undecaprenol N-acetylglucosamine transferase [Cellvibrio zantedeschiae]